MKNKAVGVAVRSMIVVVILGGTLSRACAEPPKQGNQDLSRRVEKLFDLLGDLREEIPRETFDPREVVKKAGKEPGALLAWVRTNTWWVPYRGSLRGARGVLMDRLGNSLDRSLLLAALLRQAGHTVRLAQANLPPDEATSLLDKLSPAGKAWAGRLRPSVDGESTLEARARKYSLPEESIRHYNGQGIVHQRHMEEALERLQEQAAALEAALGKSRMAIDAPQVLPALQDHWWVQCRQGQAWIDLDPLAEAARPDRRAATTIDPGKLGDEHLHLLVVRVTIEQWKRGALRDEEVLSCVIRPSETAAQTIMLQHVPLQWSQESAPRSAAELRKALLAPIDWMPVLTVGKRAYASASFNQHGQVERKPNLSGAGRVGQSVGGTMGGLGGFLGGGDQRNKPPAPEGHLTAVWLDLELRQPGRPPQVIRREVFDLLGPARRTAKPCPQPTFADSTRIALGQVLLGRTEVLAATCELSPAFAVDSMIDRHLQRRKDWIALLGQGDAARRDEQWALLAEQSTEVGPLHMLALARTSLAAWPRQVYLNQVNLLAYRTYLRVDEKDEWSRIEQMDVAHNGVAALPGAEKASLAAEVRQGLADTLAEHLVLRGQTETCENTTVLFAHAAAQGLKPLTVEPGQVSALEKMEIPPDVRRRVEVDLQHGCIVILPSAPVGPGKRLGWWRVHPGTGQTVGVMDNGFHADTTEQAYLQNDTVISRTVVSKRFTIRSGNRFYSVRHSDPYWSRDPYTIARELGFPQDMDIIGAIVDHQWALLRAGLI